MVLQLPMLPGDVLVIACPIDRRRRGPCRWPMRNTWSCSATQSQVSEFCDKGVKRAGVRRLRQTDHLGSSNDHEPKGVALRPTHPQAQGLLTITCQRASSAPSRNANDLRRLLASVRSRSALAPNKQLPKGPRRPSRSNCRAARAVYLVPVSGKVSALRLGAFCNLQNALGRGLTTHDCNMQASRYHRLPYRSAYGTRA